uniref:Glucose-methanol-choline oxidoreductase N-terminal domain-containing protein n=1 Tax=Tanacetum cinerariifolium TaxID=118510 RepID=A0A699RE27_TANCI|nr:hypothetical protein [Tanacetum cinerariifolium]
MPDEEIAEEGVLTPLETTVQDPLLREILTENQTATDAPQEQAQPVPAATEEVDCVVIGLGAGGAPLLARLAQAGLKVVALEAGPWHDPTTDFATDEKAQNFLSRAVSGRIGAYALPLGAGSQQGLCPAAAAPE